MILKNFISQTVFVAITCTVVVTQVQATNGYFTHGVGVKDKGMAGAGVAYSVDALSAATNPAGMIWQGDRQDIGGAIFSPMRNYSVEGTPSAPAGAPCGFNCPLSIGDGDQSIDSENEAFLIPQFGQNWMLDDESAIGLSIYGNGGMNTEYKGGSALLANQMGVQTEFPGTFGDGTAGVDLAQLFISTTYSRKLSDKASWGISGIVVYQTFEAEGLGNFAGFSSDPENLSDNGEDSSTGIGVRLGIQGEVSPGITLGASYQPQISMDEFDDYSGLFAEDGGFDIPSTFTVGLAWQISAERVFLVDIQQINYEDVDAVSNGIGTLTDGSCMPGPTGGTGDGCLGGSDGAGFGWEDITIVKLGYEWRSDANWTWRFGYSHSDQPIPDDQALFNILAPGVIEDHLTFGFTRMIDGNSEWNFAFMYALEESVKGDNDFDPNQEIEIEMDQYELALSYSRSF